MNMQNNDQFSFNISLSVLDHLGRHLYRNFVTVLGEAISNAWDADAENVWIYIDKENNSFIIKDDGLGMSKDDFQNKFLKIGYSKRKDGNTKSEKNRPYIGRKGIGKLALLSCANKISLISKIEGQNYIGGVIDNSGLDQAITDDLTPQEYLLGAIDDSVFAEYKTDHEHGTIIYFEGFNDGVKNSLDFLKKLIALYFRFSLIDESFNIFLNGEKVTQNDLSDLALRTEFSWEINNFNDPYLKTLTNAKEPTISLKIPSQSIEGFIASTEKPSHLNIFGSGEKTGIDIFVNGRLREVNILKHMPSFATRHIASYLYGQIHFNELDDDKDRFTTSREGVKPEDEKYRKFLEIAEKEILSPLSNRWDELRDKYKQPSDPENNTKERRARDLFNVVSKEYTPPENSPSKTQIDTWVNDLGDDAQYNFASYAECFISENLIRRYVKEKGITLSKEANNEVTKWKQVEIDSKNKGNISIDIRTSNDDLSYLSMNDLAYLVDKKDPIKEACLARDANEYKPIRDALAHTSLLTDVAKNKLNSVYENLKGRLKTLFFDDNSENEE